MEVNGYQHLFTNILQNIFFCEKKEKGLEKCSILGGNRLIIIFEVICYVVYRMKLQTDTWHGSFYNQAASVNHVHWQIKHQLFRSFLYICL